MVEGPKSNYDLNKFDPSQHVGHKPPDSYRGDNLAPAQAKDVSSILSAPDTYKPKTHQEIEADILASRAAANKGNPQYEPHRRPVPSAQPVDKK